jgi:hypothetical protein
MCCKHGYFFHWYPLTLLSDGYGKIWVWMTDKIKHDEYGYVVALLNTHSGAIPTLLC